MASVAWFTKHFREVFWETMSEQISDSNEALYDYLLDNNAFIIRDRRDQELFFLSRSNLRDFFAIHFPSLVSFDQQRLTAWAKEAVNFARRKF